MGRQPVIHLGGLQISTNVRKTPTSVSSVPAPTPLALFSASARLVLFCLTTVGAALVSLPATYGYDLRAGGGRGMFCLHSLHALDYISHHLSPKLPHFRELGSRTISHPARWKIISGILVFGAHGSISSSAGEGGPVGGFTCTT